MDIERRKHKKMAIERSLFSKLFNSEIIEFLAKIHGTMRRFGKNAKPPMNYRNYITIEANKRGGKPCVRGLRITVYEVLEYLASDMTEAEILDDFPDLTREDLKACIAYAADRERRIMISPLSA
jgi:uncharacterized protein (DUF433 family)